MSSEEDRERIRREREEQNGLELRRRQQAAIRAQINPANVPAEPGVAAELPVDEIGDITVRKLYEVVKAQAGHQSSAEEIPDAVLDKKLSELTRPVSLGVFSTTDKEHPIKIEARKEGCHFDTEADDDASLEKLVDHAMGIAKILDPTADTFYIVRSIDGDSGSAKRLEKICEAKGCKFEYVNKPLPNANSDLNKVPDKKESEPVKDASINLPRPR
jgi:hypothetical protein